MQMKMAFLKSFLFLFFSLLALSSEARNATAEKPDTTSNKLVQNSCRHAQYPTLCIHTLSSVACSAKTPHDVALAAVSVSLHRANNVSAFASSLVGLRTGNKKERSALNDCIEQLSDSADQLARTVSELRHLRSVTFEGQMNNAETWVSAALTNEDTCLDGFHGVDGAVKKAVRKKIVNVARVTSNALYLINRLASTRAHIP
ncbi:hypothetical protein AAC387_Pa01g1353 [Persea americana]